MSLILAVEPDKRQAKQLSAVVRQQVRAELVVADSGAAALAALGNRIPDLILTPALLPPKDEAVLTGWLRKMGDAAAHVQTLAIPILAEAAGRGKDQSSSSSIFGRLRDSQQDGGQGCDPNVFADQVKVYLDRAAVERSHREPAEAAAAPTVTAAKKMASAEERVPEVEEFDDAMTFEDLVFETPGSDQPPAPAPVPVAEPPVVMKTPTPFARPEKRVEPAVLRSREPELSVESSTKTAPPLWRVGQDRQPDSVPAKASRPVPSDVSFDPNDTRYAPLFRRLDELAAQHA
jgi:CheY-like chemotaxis protein